MSRAEGVIDGQEPNPRKGMGLFRQAHLSRLS